MPTKVRPRRPGTEAIPRFQSHRRPEFVPGMLQVRIRSNAVSEVPDLGRSSPARMRGLRLPEQIERPFAALSRRDLVESLVPVFSMRTGGAALDGAPRAIAAAFATSVRDVEHDDLRGIAMLKLKPGANTASVARSLAESPGVQYADPVPARWLLQAGADPMANRQWGLRAINWFQATIPSAAEIPVAVLDTGVDAAHPDLRIDDYNHDGATAEDIIGHGTHVCGIIGAKANNGVGVAGVAHCSLNVWKIFTDEPASDGEYYVDEIMYQRALNAARSTGMQVMNLSIGGTATSRTERMLFRRLHDAGCVVVAAMGNEYNDGNPPEYPAKYPNVIAVGAIDEASRRASFSNTGRHIDMCAPGVNILSTLPIHKSVERPVAADTRYAAWSGTSMATPHVTGAASLVLAKEPTATVTRVRSLLTRRATKVPAMAGKARTNELGYGLLDLAKLLR